MFRLHIDIPLNGFSKDASCQISKDIINLLTASLTEYKQSGICGVDLIQYRLMHDNDRSNINHLTNDQSKIGNKKKCQVEIK